MDNETLNLIAKFISRARKLFGPVDLQQFIRNENYREGVFTQAEIKTDEELLTLSLLLRISFDQAKPVKLSPTVLAASTNNKNIKEGLDYAVTPSHSSTLNADSIVGSFATTS